MVFSDTQKLQSTLQFVAMVNMNWSYINRRNW